MEVFDDYCLDVHEYESLYSKVIATKKSDKPKVYDKENVYASPDENIYDDKE